MVSRLIGLKLICFAITLLISINMGTALAASEEVKQPKKEEPAPANCLTAEEAELGRLVNKLRQENKLPPIRITGALYKVAKWHVIDLALHAPHKDKTDSRDMPCDLHSWSDKGEGRGGWKAVCYTPDHYYAKQMWYKPMEIADYSGTGYENIYWTSAPISASLVMSCWENRRSERELIAEMNDWKNSKWKAMGVGIYGNYASVWLGDKYDHEDEVVKCDK